MDGKGVACILQERIEQIEKHRRSFENDVQNNPNYQLSIGAAKLIQTKVMPTSSDCPDGWDITVWNKMIKKPYRERLVIAGALIAAEIDRLDFMDKLLEDSNESA